MARPTAWAVSSAFMRVASNQIGGDTSREQLGHRRGDIQFHRVVEVAAAHGVGDDRERRSPCDPSARGDSCARGHSAQFSSQGPWLMSMQCSVTMSSWAPMSSTPSSTWGIFGNLFDLPQRELRREPHARGPELGWPTASESPLVMGTWEPALSQQRPLFGSPFHSTEAFGQKRLALSSILPHVGIDDRFARAANGLVIGHRH